MTEICNILFIRLQDEGIDVWRPTAALYLGRDLYQIESKQAIPDGESWELKPGDKIRCKNHKFQGSEKGLIAFERA